MSGVCLVALQDGSRLVRVGHGTGVSRIGRSGLLDDGDRWTAGAGMVVTVGARGGVEVEVAVTVTVRLTTADGRHGRERRMYTPTSCKTLRSA